jgi:opacity protein-like surface antigen
LTLGFDYSFSDIKTGEIKSSTTSLSAKIQNAWSFSIAPGTTLTDKTLAYFKLGFENGKAVGSSTTEVSKNITGSSWGVGMKTLFNKNNYLQVEVKQATYGAARFDGGTADFTARGTSGSVGLGFMF